MKHLQALFTLPCRQLVFVTDNQLNALLLREQWWNTNPTVIDEIRHALASQHPKGDEPPSSVRMQYTGCVLGNFLIND